MTAAAIDRLVHHSVIIELTSQQYRGSIHRDQRGNQPRVRGQTGVSHGQNGRGVSLEMPGPWKAWKAKNSFPSFLRPLGNPQKAARFPHFHSSGDEGRLKCGKPKQVFSTFPPPRMYMRSSRKPSAAGLPSARGGRSAPPKIKR